MTQLHEIAAFLEQLCPPVLAESWDNTGLLVGDPGAPVRRVMTCLTITGETVEEAVAERAELVVAHHPLPFRPLARLTTQTPEGRYLLRLIGAGVAVYSPHTAFDSAAMGINQRLAVGLQLQQIAPLVPCEAAPPGSGTGRWGTVPEGTTLATLADRVKKFLGLARVQVVGQPHRSVRRVAVACGSAGELLTAACQIGCDCLVTGETRFHACLEGAATGVSLILAGHYASERFAVEDLAGVVGSNFSGLIVWASRTERDPLEWL